MADNGKKRSHTAGQVDLPDEGFPGPHSPECKCEKCKAVRNAAKAEKAADETRKKLAAKETRLRKFYTTLAKFKVGLMSFWTALHDIISAVLSLMTVVVIGVLFWILITQLGTGEWIVPLVCLAAVMVAGWINERLG